VSFSFLWRYINIYQHPAWTKSWGVKLQHTLRVVRFLSISYPSCNDWMFKYEWKVNKRLDPTADVYRQKKYNKHTILIRWPLTAFFRSCCLFTWFLFFVLYGFVCFCFCFCFVFVFFCCFFFFVVFFFAVFLLFFVCFGVVLFCFVFLFVLYLFCFVLVFVISFCFLAVCL